jgi:Baculovirus F protein
MVFVHAFPYQIEGITNSSGIFYEHIASTKFYNSHQKLIVYTNISEFNQKQEFIFDTYIKALASCGTNNMDWFFCKQILADLKYQVPKLQSKENVVLHLITRRRQKRGWINAIGSVFKVLFGTLDASDAEYYDDAIEKVSSDEKNILLLMKDHTQILKSSIMSFNSTVKSFEVNRDILANDILKFNNLTDDLNMVLQNLRVYEETLSRLSILSHMVNELHVQYDELIDAILFAKKGVLHPAFISPSQFVEKLISSLDHVPKGLTYPLDLSIENAHSLMDISSLQAYSINSKIVIIISIPLVVDNIFNLYHLLSFPTPHKNNKTFVYIQPSYKYLAVTNPPTVYVPLDNLVDCIEIFPMQLICKNVDAISYSVEFQPICETSLLVPKTSKIPSDCTVKYMQGPISVFHKLQKINKWIFIMSASSPITFNCNGNLLDSYLLFSGILSINQGCTAYLDFGLTKIRPSVESSAYEYHNVIPQIDILSDSCCADISEKPVLNVHKLDPIIQRNLNLEDLNVLYHKLDQHDNSILELSLHPHFVRYSNYYKLTICILLSIIVSYVIYRKYFFKRRQPNPSSNLPQVSITFPTQPAVQEQPSENNSEPEQVPLQNLPRRSTRLTQRPRHLNYDN